MRYLIISIIIFLLTLTSNKILGQKIDKRKDRKIAKSIQNYEKIDILPYHFGFSLACNLMDYSFTLSNKTLPDGSVIYADVNSPGIGYTIGLLGEIRLSKFISLRLLPGISSNTKLVEFNRITPSTKKIDKHYRVPVENFYVDVPLLFKYKSKKINNARAYIVGGTCFRFNTQGSKGVDIVNDRYIDTKKFDLYFEIGVGIDKYNEYFKLSPEIKLSLGLFNILNKTPDALPNEIIFTDAIDQLFSRIFIFSLHFE